MHDHVWRMTSTRALPAAAEVRRPVAACRRAGRGRAASPSRRRVIYPLKQVTPVLSLGVLYVLAVVVVSMFWGLVLRDRHERSQRRRLQLLPPAARGPLRAGRRSRLGGAAGVRRGRGRHRPARRARARPRPRGRAAPPGGRPVRRDGAAAARQRAAARTRLRLAAQRLAAAIGVALRGDLAASELDGDEQRLAFALRSAGRPIGTLLLAEHALRAPSARGSPSASCPRSSRSWPPRCTAPSCRPRSSRRLRCGAATS